MFAGDIVCVEGVALFVVFGIWYVVERFVNSDEAFLLAGGVGACCLNDGWCGVIGGGCGLAETLATIALAELCLLDDLFKHFHVIAEFGGGCDFIF